MCKLANYWQTPGLGWQTSKQTAGKIWQTATQKNIHNIIPVCTHETKTKHNNHLDKHCDYKKLLLLLLLLNK